MVSRVKITGSNSSGKVQTLQVQRSDSETFDDVEHFEKYGYTARPLDGAEGITVARGGFLSNLIALVVGDPRYRLKGLKKGEVAIYDDLGNQIVLRRNKIEVKAVTHIDVTAPTATITATTTHQGNLTLNGNLVVNGAISSTGQISSPVGVSAAGKELKTHTHGGVAAGSDNTGAPN